MISIIVPVYKVEKYLKKCIDSVLSQSFQDYELILVDDGSPDNCGAICDDYAATDHKIFVIHKENGGLSSARNAGLDVAKGDYILFLDSDDTLTENALQTLYDAIVASGSDIVFAGYNAVDEVGNILHRFMPKEELLTGDRKFTIVYEQLPLVMAAIKLYKRKIFDAYRFLDGKKHEDVFAYHEIVHNADSIYCIAFPFINYLQRSDSITGKAFSAENFDAVDALFARVDFFAEKKMEICSVQTINFIYKYLIYIIHNIDLSNPVLAQAFQAYYKRWKALSGNNKDAEFKLIYQLYRHKILKKPFATTILFSLMKKTRLLIKSRKTVLKLLSVYFRRKPNFILISTPLHGNLGDQAIVYAQKKLLLACGVKNIVEMKSVDYLSHASVINKIVRKRDVIVIDGGGNIGTLWPTEAERIKSIIRRFSKNKIIIFPETAYFSNDFTGTLECKLTKEVYEAHPNLFVFLRDVPSYTKMKEMLPDGNVFLCPDIVISLKDKLSLPRLKREGALLLLRHDSEKNLDDSATENIKQMLHDLKIDYELSDTVLEHYVTEQTREQELNTLFHKFCSKQLVITDRLHGMIFAYVTNTPCIALNNINKKVEGQYKWIADSENIILVNSAEEIKKAIDVLANNTSTEYTDLSAEFHALESIVRNFRA